MPESLKSLDASVEPKIEICLTTSFPCWRCFPAVLSVSLASAMPKTNGKCLKVLNTPSKPSYWRITAYPLIGASKIIIYIYINCYCYNTFFCTNNKLICTNSRTAVSCSSFAEIWVHILWKVWIILDVRWHVATTDLCSSSRSRRAPWLGMILSEFLLMLTWLEPIKWSWPSTVGWLEEDAIQETSLVVSVWCIFKIQALSFPFYIHHLRPSRSQEDRVPVSGEPCHNEVWWVPDHHFSAQRLLWQPGYCWSKPAPISCHFGNNEFLHVTTIIMHAHYFDLANARVVIQWLLIPFCMSLMKMVEATTAYSGRLVLQDTTGAVSNMMVLP